MDMKGGYFPRRKLVGLEILDFISEVLNYNKWIAPYGSAQNNESNGADDIEIRGCQRSYGLRSNLGLTYK